MLFDKRGIQLVAGTVIFIVLNVTVIMILIYAIQGTSTRSPLYEEAYAKQIGLLIDASKPGTTINVDLTEIYQIAKNNEVNPEIVIDCVANEVYIKATQGNGYRFGYFTKLDSCEYVINREKRRLTIKV